MEEFKLTRACPKCGCKSAKAKWYPAIREHGAEVEPEYIWRECSTCEYAWEEAPLKED